MTNWKMPLNVLGRLSSNPRYTKAYIHPRFDISHAGQSGRGHRALPQAVKFKPELLTVHMNLGLVLMAAKRLSEAEASYRLALALRPDYACACGVFLTHR